MGSDNGPVRHSSVAKGAATVARLLVKRPVVAILLLILTAAIFIHNSSDSTSEGRPSLHDPHHLVSKSQRATGVPYPYEEKGPFYSYRVHGFDNNAEPGGAHAGYNLSCHSLETQFEIGVQRPWDIKDDMTQIAQELDDHPMVYYTQKVFGQKPGQFQLSQVVEASWDRLAGSCILLPDRDVFLCIARIIFHDDARRDHIQISFLRGQIFSRSWVHLQNYELWWKGRKIVFPRIFDTGTEFVPGGDVYGPEDPRIIMEHDTYDAEPVIVFNMISEQAHWKRAMWIFRPFSEQSNILTINGVERRKKEKNWAPFFVKDVKKGSEGKPNPYIHFIYNFSPLEILKCRLSDGLCENAYLQNVPADLRSIHDNEWSELRGGTQWVPIPLPKRRHSSKTTRNLQAWVSFPRTHTERTPFCFASVYRPELTIMVSNGTDFYFPYVSGPLEFGVDNLLSEADYYKPCDTGRILIVNSIADWDFNARTTYTEKTDVMTLAVTVMDATVQAMRVSGILKLIYALPSMDRLLYEPKAVFGDGKNTKDIHDDRFVKHSAVSLDVRQCAEEASRDYITEHILGDDKPKLLERVTERKRLYAIRMVEYPNEDHHPRMEQKGH